MQSARRTAEIAAENRWCRRGTNVTNEEEVVYDIAHRIGAYLRREPEAVYLHAGTREGARALNLGGESN
jgi:hypothetical protein